MSINEYIFFTPAVIYLLRVIFFSIGAKIERIITNRNLKNDYTPFVSVVVPARNEENNIARCIRSIEASNYPKELYEIIIVNDRSEDDTLKRINEFAESNDQIRIVNITEINSNPNLRGKAGALDEGIKAAKGEIVLMTDADCSVSPDWIATMSKGFANKKIGMIPSFTLVKYINIFHRFQAIEWIFMETMASGGIGLRQPIGCFGNNVGIRKSHYNDFGGYAKIPFSVTEDLALMSAMNKAKKGIKFFTSDKSTVKSLPCDTFVDYIRQHRRWTIGGQALGWKAAFFVLSSVAIWSGVILSIIYSSTEMLGLVLATRLLGDFVIITPTLIKIKDKKLIPWIFPAVLFFMILELIVPCFLLNKEVIWKGQKFN